MEGMGNGVDVVALLHEVMILVKQNAAKVFENSGITHPQGMVIGTLGKEGRMKITELSEKLGLSNSTISGIVDRLERSEIVERNRSEEDKRVVYVALTDRFKEMHKDVHLEVRKKIEASLMKGTPEDIRKVCEGLNTIKKLLNDS